MHLSPRKRGLGLSVSSWWPADLKRAVAVATRAKCSAVPLAMRDQCATATVEGVSDASTPCHSPCRSCEVFCRKRECARLRTCVPEMDPAEVIGGCRDHELKECASAECRLARTQCPNRKVITDPGDGRWACARRSRPMPLGHKRRGGAPSVPSSRQSRAHDSCQAQRPSANHIELIS